MLLGEVIKRYREENHLSMEAFAKKSGISKPYIGVIENNSHPGSKKPVHPSVRKIKMAAVAMDMDFDDLLNMIDEEISIENDNDDNSESTILSSRIPVLGRVAAGVPIDAIEDITGYVEIPQNLAVRGEFFGLKIRGNSMEPRIFDGDTVIVMSSKTAESGDIIIASVNESEVVCKKFIKYGRSKVLRSLNPTYDDIDVSKNPDFKIIGVVVELRAELKSI